MKIKVVKCRNSINYSYKRFYPTTTLFSKFGNVFLEMYPQCTPSSPPLSLHLPPPLIYPFLHLSLPPFVIPPTNFYLSLLLFICPSFYLSLHLSFPLSISPSLFPFLPASLHLSFPTSFFSCCLLIPLSLSCCLLRFPTLSLFCHPLSLPPFIHLF